MSRTAWILVLSTALVFIAGTILIRGGHIGDTAAWIFPAATALLGIATMRAYVMFLRAADELLRKIHIEALAIGFGAGAILMLAWRLAERLGAPKLDSNDPLLAMLVFSAVGHWLGVRRFSGGEEEQ